jgi:hypothetical protein
MVSESSFLIDNRSGISNLQTATTRSVLVFWSMQTYFVRELLYLKALRNPFLIVHNSIPASLTGEQRGSFTLHREILLQLQSSSI